MELRQLEYFVCVADYGSINRAAEALFTAQPNVSKVINALEKELNVQVFERNNKGVRLTTYGEQIYDYAKRTLQNVEMITTLVEHKDSKNLRIACYPSHIITHILRQYYELNNTVKMNLIEDTVENIVEYVSSKRVDIGLVYISEDQRCCFNHTLSHKNMSFELLYKRQACIYLGSHHPFYQRNEIEKHELSQLKWIQTSKDFFSTDQHLEQQNLDYKQKLNYVISTNSDHMVRELLLNTDLCTFGMQLNKFHYESDQIKAIKIKDYEHHLLLGYIVRKGEILSQEAEEFLKILINKLGTN